MQMPNPGPIPNIADANPDVMAKDILDLMQMWGMTRRQAKRVAEIMARKMNDQTFPWKDMRDTNSEETRNMLAAPRKGGLILPS